jgi:hypothetical protein
LIPIESGAFLCLPRYQLVVRASTVWSWPGVSFLLEQFLSKKKVLAEYTRPRTIKNLESEVEKARSEEWAKHAGWALEMSREAELEKRIARLRRGT